MTSPSMRGDSAQRAPLMRSRVSVSPPRSTDSAWQARASTARAEIASARRELNTKLEREIFMMMFLPRVSVSSPRGFFGVRVFDGRGGVLQASIADAPGIDGCRALTEEPFGERRRLGTLPVARGAEREHARRLA